MNSSDVIYILTSSILCLVPCIWTLLQKRTLRKKQTELQHLQKQLQLQQNQYAQKEKELQDTTAQLHAHIHSFAREKEELHTQLHTLESQIETLVSDAKKAVSFREHEATQQQLREAHEQIQLNQQRIHELERQHKSQIGKVITLQEKLKIAAQEIQKWNEKHLREHEILEQGV